MAIKLEELEAKQGFSYAVEDGVAVITFDLPDSPVNTLSPEVGEVFARLLERAQHEPAVKAVVRV